MPRPAFAQPTMRTSGVEPRRTLLSGGQDRRLRTGTDGAHRSPVSADSRLRFAADGSVASGTGPCGESQAGAALDAADGTGGHLPTPAHQQAGTRASDLSVPLALA